MLTYDMDQRAQQSRYEYLYRCIRRDIETGVICAGEKLPSKRTLARHLGISVITVEAAYSQLVAEGYVRAEERRGYFAESLPAFATSPVAAGSLDASSPVAAGLLNLPSQVVAAESLCGSPADAAASAASVASPVPTSVLPAGSIGSLAAARMPSLNNASSSDRFATPTFSSASATLVAPFASAFCASVPPALSDVPVFADFTSGSMPVGLFPFNAWVKAMREALSREPENLLLGDTPACGLLRLRQAIASHLRGFRGMVVDPDCIVVGAGAQVLYNMIVQLLGRNLRYAVEEPGYPRLTSIYRANDADVRHVSLDSGGISIAALDESGANVAHIMPSHQFPTGLVTSAARRFELLEWAANTPGHYIVEDDYDCEFRFSGRPVPSLASVDTRERVIYTNTFTKTLGPAFRIGYMILPPHLAQQFINKLGFYSCTVSAVDQLALARFMESGAYERHVNRMRKYCKTMKEKLISELKNSEFGGYLGGRLRFEAASAGLHFVMVVDGVDEAAFAQSARAEGVALAPLSAFCAQGEAARPLTAASRPRSRSSSADSRPCARFVMSYAGIDLAAIPRIVSALARVAHRL